MVFQSTHPHGVRRLCRCGSVHHLQVSIHAPTRGATSSARVTACCSNCFNPRTHTGCDLLTGDLYAGWLEFQSTHPHGVRPAAGLSRAETATVSIHAPTRGATKQSTRIKKSKKFQSTHPHGVRHKISMRILKNFVFQSTHPHGVRPDGASSDDFVQLVSIHAPTRGATFALSNIKIYIYVSIHAPTRGATHSAVFSPQNAVFQSTHPHGVRRARQAVKNRRHQFQSTHPHGVRRSGYANEQYRDLFQSTHPHGVRHHQEMMER